MTDLRAFSRAIPTLFSDPWALVEVWRHDFSHVDTGLLEPDLARVRNIAGYSVWGNPDGLQVWFEWIEVKPRVVALRDPMGIKVNARFTDARGGPAPAEMVPVFLATVVHHLPWQPRVLGWLSDHGETVADVRARHRRERIASQVRLPN